eukprot:2251503-Rhodomonas_salina.1
MAKRSGCGRAGGGVKIALHAPTRGLCGRLCCCCGRLLAVVVLWRRKMSWTQKLCSVHVFRDRWHLGNRALKPTETDATAGASSTPRA